MTDITALEAKLAEAVAAHDEADRRERDASRAVEEARGALIKARWGVAVGDVVMADGGRYRIGQIMPWAVTGEKPDLIAHPERKAGGFSERTRYLSARKWEPLP